MKTTIAVLLIIGAFVITSQIDYAEALTAEAMQKDTPKFPAHLVIPYDIVVCQDSGAKPHCKWYLRASTRREIR